MPAATAIHFPSADETGAPDERDASPASASRRALPVSRRLVLEFTLIALGGAAAVALSVLWATHAAEDSVRDSYAEQLNGLAFSASQSMRAVSLERPDTGTQRSETAIAELALERLREFNAEVRGLHLVLADGEQLYVGAHGASDARPLSMGTLETPRDPEGDAYRDAATHLRVGRDASTVALGASNEPSAASDGETLVGFAPFFDRDGATAGFVGVDVGSARYREMLERARRDAQRAIAPGATVVFFLMIAFMHIRRRGLAATDRALTAIGRAKRATSVLQQEQSRLQDSEHRFRGLFELSPVGIALNDMQTGKFLQVNDALVGPTGYAREELLELTYWDITPGTYSQEEQTQLALLQNTGAYGPYEKEYVRKDGSKYHVLLSGMRMTEPSGRDVIWSIVQDISSRKAVESKLTEAARQDKLTGLANRALFMERLRSALDRVRMGHQQLVAILFLDFDRFKLVNDTMGHGAGDELLRQIAARLRSSMRSSDAMSNDIRSNQIARFGGDEFVVLINDLHEPNAATAIAERLLDALAQPYTIHGREVHSTASIGIVTSDSSKQSPEDLIRNADVAMYEAKRSGRACSAVFNEAMHTRLTRHMTIENSLRRALGTSELSLEYQPIIDLDSRRMVSAEALARWNHPLLGSISPQEFIPIAEDSGLIVSIGDWVLHEACQQLATWRASGSRNVPDRVSVNVSRIQLALGERFASTVRETLRATGLPAQCLQLEVTESEVMRDPAASHRLLRSLRKLGVSLAMDDFGTGTSSLACLREYPFHIVKIDRSFVSDLKNGRDVLAVLRATITLIENLGMHSVAEGVETAAQVATLKSLGCRLAQGFYFSRPVVPHLLLELGNTLAAQEMQEPVTS